MNIVQDNVAQILVHFTKQKQQILEELQEQREETEKQLKQYEALQKSIMAAPTPDIVRFNVIDFFQFSICRLEVKFLQQVAKHY